MGDGLESRDQEICADGDRVETQAAPVFNGSGQFAVGGAQLSRKSTGLEESAELARRINRWPALRNVPGDEKAYELARAVQKLHRDVQNNTVEIEAGLEEIEPLIRQIMKIKGGGPLFDETRDLATQIGTLQLNRGRPAAL